VTIEECLRRIEHSAAMLRYAFDAAAFSPEMPPAEAVSGFADACDDIRQLARRMKRAIDASILDIETRG
jgi:hypothetical protein